MSDIRIELTSAIAGLRALNQTWECSRGNIIHAVGQVGPQNAQSFVVHEVIIKLGEEAFIYSAVQLLTLCRDIFLHPIQYILEANSFLLYSVAMCRIEERIVGEIRIENLGSSMKDPLALQIDLNMAQVNVSLQLPAALVNNISDFYLLGV